MTKKHHKEIENTIAPINNTVASRRNNKRTWLIKRNVLMTFLLKGWGGIVFLVLMAVTLRCLGIYENGIWLTISSVIAWIDLMDLGLGNGLRNMLTTTIAQGDLEKARVFVSTTFFMLIGIVIPLAVLCLALINYVDIYSILNVDSTRVPNLKQVICAAVMMVCVGFIFKFIGNIFMALQFPAISQGLVVGGQTVGLLLTIILYLCKHSSLLLVTLANTISPLIVYSMAYFITFHKLYPHLRPSIRHFKRSALAQLFTLGMKFFMLQMAGLIIFASSSILISHIFSPSEVTNYQVTYRYFSILTLLFTIVLVPFWSATTDAYEHEDWEWIRTSAKSIMKVMLLAVAIVVCMIVIAPTVYAIWLGNEVYVRTSTNILMAIYIMLLMYSLTYSTILNGMGKLNLQIVTTTIAAIIFIPLVFALTPLMGLNGIIVALILVNAPGAFINNWQYRHALKTERINSKKIINYSYYE